VMHCSGRRVRVCAGANGAGVTTCRNSCRTTSACMQGEGGLPSDQQSTRARARTCMAGPRGSRRGMVTVRRWPCTAADASSVKASSGRSTSLLSDRVWCGARARGRGARRRMCEPASARARATAPCAGMAQARVGAASSVGRPSCLPCAECCVCFAPSLCGVAAAPTRASSAWQACGVRASWPHTHTPRAHGCIHQQRVHCMARGAHDGA
jgi:hypothetical protein